MYALASTPYLTRHWDHEDWAIAAYLGLVDTASIPAGMVVDLSANMVAAYLVAKDDLANLRKVDFTRSAKTLQELLAVAITSASPLSTRFIVRELVAMDAVLPVDYFTDLFENTEYSPRMNQCLAIVMNDRTAVRWGETLHRDVDITGLILLRDHGLLVALDMIDFDDNHRYYTITVSILLSTRDAELIRLIGAQYWTQQYVNACRMGPLSEDWVWFLSVGETEEYLLNCLCDPRTPIRPAMSHIAQRRHFGTSELYWNVLWGDNRVYTTPKQSDKFRILDNLVCLMELGVPLHTDILSSHAMEPYAGKLIARAIAAGVDIGRVISTDSWIPDWLIHDLGRLRQSNRSSSRPALPPRDPAKELRAERFGSHAYY